MPEKIIETKQCKRCWTSFTITDKDRESLDKISPVFAWKKIQIPSPTWCPQCRQQRRFAFRNERKLYRRKCDATGEDIISIYSPDYPGKVYNHSSRRSDSRDGMDYGRDFDFSKPFFQQMNELMLEVPMVNLRNWESENSSYTHCCYQNKNCYMLFNTDHSEDSFHSYLSDNLQHCIDCTFTFGAQQSYECIDCRTVYQCFFSQRCKNCNDCHFCLDCEQCQYCFGCVNLRNQHHCFFNEQLSPEDYQKKIQELWTRDAQKIQEIKEKLQQFSLTQPTLAAHILNAEQCSGDFVYNSKHTTDAFDCFDALEDCKHVVYGEKDKNVMDAYAFIDVQNCYEVMSGVDMYNSKFMLWINHGPNDSLYCVLCVNNCDNLFGCVGLKNKHYCIFNKQYTKDEYEALVPKIIEHMKKTWERGEYFPIAISPFAYNETIAQEYFPLTKEQVLSQWWKWKDEDDRNFQSSVYVPLSIEQYDEKVVWDELANKNKDDLINSVLKCEVTGRPYKIIKPELAFYIKRHLPLPLKHPDQRHIERMHKRNPRKLRECNCAKCWIPLATSYSSDRPEIVYCEACYNKEVYG